MANIEHINSRLKQLNKQSLSHKLSHKTADEQIRDAMIEHGIEPPLNIQIPSKEFVRFSKSGNGNKKPRFYRFDMINGIVYGVFGCWSENKTINFKQQTDRALTAHEIELFNIAKKNLELETKKQKEQQQQNAIKTLQQIWEGLPDATDDHPYLINKKINNHGLRVTIGDDRLVYPLYNDSGELCSIQYISGDGKKQNYKGVSAKNLVNVFGHTDDASRVFIATGYSTCASIYESTNEPVISVLGDSNLQGGVEYALKHYSNAKIFLIVDNDSDKKNSGQNAAAKIISDYPSINSLIIPTIGHDANDYVNSGGDLESLIDNACGQSDDEWLVEADDFCSKPAPIKWLVKNWIPQNSLIMMHGPSGGGKTFAVLDMCCHITTGASEWQNHIVKKGSVVYLAGEGHHGLKARLAAWKQQHGADTLGKFYLSRGGCNLNSVEGLSLVTQQIDKLKEPPSLIVVDTLHRFLDGDENTAKDAKSMLDACAELTYRYNCSVMLVHHTGVSAESQHRARGSSAWRGALDIEISVQPKDGVIEFIQYKNKDAELTKSKVFELESVEIDGWFDDDEEQVTSAVIKQSDRVPTPKKDKAAENHSKTFSDAWVNSSQELVDNKPYITKSNVRDYLQTLVDEGEITAGTAKQAIKSSNKRGLIGCLMLKGIIKEWQDGWILLDENRINGVMIRSKYSLSRE